jgi:DNA-binding transcriptional LysR family regulator
MYRLNVKFLKLLYFFSVVAECGNISHAAKRLDISQPPLSAALSELEHILGYPLFERSRSGVELTEEAKNILPTVKAFIAHAEMVNYSVMQAHAPKKLINVASVHDAMFHILSPVVMEFEEKNVPLQLFVKEEDSSDLIDVVLRNEVDFAVGYIWRRFGEGVNIKPIARVPLRIILPTIHPLAKARELSLRELERESFIIIGREASPYFYDKVFSLFDSYAIDPVIRHEVSSLSRMLAYAACGQGIGLMPYYAKQTMPANLVAVPIKEEDAYTELSAVYKKETSEIKTVLDAVVRAGAALG